MKQIPMRPSSIYTEQINTKVDPTLKDDIEKLKYLKVDVAALIRDAIRKGVDQAFHVLNSKAQAS